MGSLKGTLVRTLLNPSLWINRLVISHFHRLYYYAENSWRANAFSGHGVQQLPSDLWLYQEILFQRRPQMILQTGVFRGGSLLYFAKMLDAFDAPATVPVVGIDIELTGEARRLTHPRIHLIEGNSVDATVIAQVEGFLGRRRGMVILDSDHHCAHVGAELESYSHLVAVGQYLVVEDTNLNGHPVEPSHGPGPMEAVREFARCHPEFVPDDQVWLRQLFSHHHRGWLLRRADTQGDPKPLAADA